jgi:hypothetical protein
MGRKLINAFLLLVIAGLLFVYYSAVSDLPGRLYTYEQLEYLSYNDSRSISQRAPALNYLPPDGMTGTAFDIPSINPSRESRVRANLKARYEEQQGVTVTIYDLEFQGEYLLVGPTSSAVEVELIFRFPDNLETLHDVRFTVDGVEPPDTVYTTDAISWHTTLLSDDTHRMHINYKANGANTFAYGLPRDQRSDLDVVVTVAGPAGSSVPRTSLPATDSSSASGSEAFTWNYTGLIANRDIQVSLPTRLSFVQRIAQLQDDFRMLAWLAPFLVGLFVTSLAGLFLLNGLHMRLEGYLLAGLGLALFYPLLTFTSGLIGILPAALLSWVVISGLLFAFVGLTVGWAKTWRPLGILLLIFAGFFSLGMLTPWRGLLLTGGGLLLLATLMWAYAHRPAKVLTPQPEHTDAADLPKANVRGHCVHCGLALEDAYTFCPGCGHDVRVIRRCDDCGQQQVVPSDGEPTYCVHCGSILI